MNTAIKIFVWCISILFLNLFGRFLLIYFSPEGYTWLSYYYIMVAGGIATIIALIIFFTTNHFITKKRKELIKFSFTKIRLLIMVTAILIAFLGEKIYLHFFG